MNAALFLRSGIEKITVNLVASFPLTLGDRENHLVALGDWLAAWCNDISAA